MMRRQRRDVLALKTNMPFTWRHETGDQIKKRGLARSVGTDDRAHLARFNVEADLVDRGKSAELPRHPFNAEQAPRAHTPPSFLRAVHKRDSEAMPLGA